jgi:hypothetical protein
MSKTPKALTANQGQDDMTDDDLAMMIGRAALQQQVKVLAGVSQQDQQTMAGILMHPDLALIRGTFHGHEATIVTVVPPKAMMEAMVKEAQAKGLPIQDTMGVILPVAVILDPARDARYLNAGTSGSVMTVGDHVVKAEETRERKDGFGVYL